MKGLLLLFLLLLFPNSHASDVESLRVRTLKGYRDGHYAFWKLCATYLGLEIGNPDPNECEISIMKTFNKTALQHFLKGMNTLTRDESRDIYRLRGRALDPNIPTDLYIHICKHHFRLYTYSDGKPSQDLHLCRQTVLDCVNPKILQNFLYLLNK
jgi:hypothetical protein